MKFQAIFPFQHSSRLVYPNKSSQRFQLKLEPLIEAVEFLIVFHQVILVKQQFSYFYRKFCLSNLIIEIYFCFWHLVKITLFDGFSLSIQLFLNSKFEFIFLNVQAIFDVRLFDFQFLIQAQRLNVYGSPSFFKFLNLKLIFLCFYWQFEFQVIVSQPSFFSYQQPQFVKFECVKFESQKFQKFGFRLVFHAA